MIHLKQILVMEQSKNKGDNLKLFMKIGFISDFLIDLIDNLAETKDYKHNLKFHLNKVLEELTKHNNEFYNLFNDKSLNTDEVKNIDIYNIISDAYNYLMEKEPYTIAQMVYYLKASEDRGLDFSKLQIEYKPINT